MPNTYANPSIAVTAQRLSAYASHDEAVFLGVLGALILLWAVGGKLLIG